MLVEIPQNPKVMRLNEKTSCWDPIGFEDVHERDKVIFYNADWKVFQLQEGSIFVNGSIPCRVNHLGNRRHIDVEFV